MSIAANTHAGSRLAFIATFLAGPFPMETTYTRPSRALRDEGAGPTRCNGIAYRATDRHEHP